MAATEPRRLVDTSVLLRGDQPAVAERLDKLVLNGRMWTCRMVDLEYAYARGSRDIPGLLHQRRALPEAPIGTATMDLALDILERLATSGRHRHAKAADCVIAASAVQAGISVLHYDRDFERIAEVIGLETEWVAPAGSLDGG